MKRMAALAAAAAVICTLAVITPTAAQSPGDLLQKRGPPTAEQQRRLCINDCNKKRTREERQACQAACK
jgi:hypothetical protein